MADGRTIPGPRTKAGSGPPGNLGAAALCIVLVAILAACTQENDPPGGEVQAQSQVQSTAIQRDIPDSSAQKTPPISADRASVEVPPVQREKQPPELETGDGTDPPGKPAKEQSSKLERAFPDKGNVAEATAELAEQFGGEVHYLDHPQREISSVLVLPQGFSDGETPLIVSLHGFGGNSADHAEHVPLQERVNDAGFALLLPNGQTDGEGNQFWNPTDECCDGGKSGGDDVAFLRQVVASAREVREFGPVYVFGYSNGGFMAYHMACKGLPGLRAIISVAGTSYVDDEACDEAPAVSVLHIHGSDDEVIRFTGDRSEREQSGDGEPAFYAGAREMIERWSQRAGCARPLDAQPAAALDLDRFVPGAETQVFRLEPACAQGVDIEMWVAEGSGHVFAYSDTFLDALIKWLDSQE